MSASLHDTVLLTVGHTGKCTACHLCLKTNLKMKHPYQMSSNAQYKPVYEWLKEHKPTIDEIACLCLPCVKQIQRNHDRNFTPRWLLKPSLPPKSCSVETCKSIVHAQTSLVTVDELETRLREKVTSFTIQADQSASIGLCKEHYMQMYQSLHSSPCDSCQAKPRKGQTFNRHCSSPEVVNEYVSGCAYFKQHTSAFPDPRHPRHYFIVCVMLHQHMIIMQNG